MPNHNGNKPGFFITLEGGEGVGKSTQQARLVRRLRSHGITVVETREPGGAPFSERIRPLLVQGKSDSITEKTELLLMIASRIEHVHKIIHPALREGKWVVCDRFIDSTLAYQGYGRRMDLNRIKQLNHWALGDLKPDLTLLLDLSPHLGLDRAVSRPSLTNLEEKRFEQEGVMFHERVYRGFLSLAEAEPDRFRTIDASKSQDQVENHIWKWVSHVIPNP